MSFNRWTAEAQCKIFTKYLLHDCIITRLSIDTDSISVYSNVFIFDNDVLGFGYTLNRLPFDFGIAFLIGVMWRILGFILMVCLNRDKQK